jgi:multidrug efflux system outer membrane protein
MYKFSAAVALSAVLLSGCTMIPHYNRPDMPVAAQWPVEAPSAVDAQGKPLTPAASIAWQEFFRSAHMQQVIATALEHNRDLRIATLNVEAVRNAYRLQRGVLFPDVTGEVAGSKQRISQNVPFNQAGSTSFINEFYTAEVAASYGLDFFGRARSLNRSAFEEFLASEEAQRTVQVSLIAETANAYLQLLADREILQLTQKTFDAQNRSFELVSKRFDNGIADKLELSQAQIPLETARVNHALYTRLVQQDMNALTVLMGKDNAELLLAEQELANVQLLEALPVGLPSQVLLLRPDIRQAEHVLLSANADIGAARAAFFPSVSLTASIGQASGELSDLFSSAAGSIWSFSPSISVPIFQGGRNWANLLITEAQRDIAVAEYEKAIQQAFREVADELAAKATLDEQLKAQADLVKAATAAYETSQARYDQGIDNFLSVLDAQRSQYEAQQALIETQKQRLANRVNLYKVLGGGQLSYDQTPADEVEPEKS